MYGGSNQSFGGQAGLSSTFVVDGYGTITGFDQTYSTSPKGWCVAIREQYWDATHLNFSDILESINGKNVTDASLLFCSLDVTTASTLPKIPTTITSLNNAFYQYREVQEIGAITFNNNITGLYSFVAGCRKLTTIDFSKWDTSNVTTIGSIFNGCQSLVSLDLSGLDFTNLTDMGAAFFYCLSLTHLDIRSISLENISIYNNMFGSSQSSGPPNNCEIIVKDDTSKTWLTSKFPRLTNVKTVAEL